MQSFPESPNATIHNIGTDEYIDALAEIIQINSDLLRNLLAAAVDVTRSMQRERMN
jgi:hypothetical protein